MGLGSLPLYTHGFDMRGVHIKQAFFMRDRVSLGQRVSSPQAPYWVRDMADEGHVYIVVLSFKCSKHNYSFKCNTGFER